MEIFRPCQGKRLQLLSSVPPSTFPIWTGGENFNHFPRASVIISGLPFFCWVTDRPLLPSCSLVSEAVCSLLPQLRISLSVLGFQMAVSWFCCHNPTLLSYSFYTGIIGSDFRVSLPRLFLPLALPLSICLHAGVPTPWEICLVPEFFYVVESRETSWCDFF